MHMLFSLANCPWYQFPNVGLFTAGGCVCVCVWLWDTVVTSAGFHIGTAQCQTAYVLWEGKKRCTVFHRCKALVLALKHFCHICLCLC